MVTKGSARPEIMQKDRSWKKALSNDAGQLGLLCLAWLVLLTLVSLLAAQQYGFHRDELASLDNGLHMDWGFVEYPPFTPFMARLSILLFGPSLVGLRFMASLAVTLAMLLTGLMVVELGGSRRSQWVAALSVGIAPIVLFTAHFFSYQTFDYLWWVLAAYLLIRLINTGNPQWWLAIGAVLGLGMMTKYTIGFLAIGIVTGVLFTPARKFLKSPWLCAGAGLSFLIFLPNVIWQVQHNFISFQFLAFIHNRDIAIGRTGAYLTSQLYICTNIATIFLWIAGLRYYWFHPEGKRYRCLGWLFVAPFILFLVFQGRYYYLAPAYPMLIAAGTLLSNTRSKGLYGSLVIGALASMAITFPLAPVNSGWWKVAISMSGELREEVGWHELVKTAADIRDTLPARELSQVGILAGNYGEAAAINLYGPQYALPPAISGTDSYWLRGYGDHPPQTMIVLGMSQKEVEKLFESCTLAGHSSNRFGIENEEVTRHADIFVCRRLRQPWPEFWKSFLHFG
jgi:4-amino-4-deoxy-L-arabinose transferase-like glycosyltransferase